MPTRTITIETKWYCYRQNNSGGRWKAPAINVFIEAQNTREADTIAETIGLYFDDSDCECCGSRWDKASDYNEQEDGPPTALAPSKSEDTYSKNDKIDRTVKLSYGEAYPVVIPVDPSLKPEAW